MSIKTQRKRFLAISRRLKSGKNLTKKEIEYFANCFEEIGQGSDANKVLGLAYGKGKSKHDEDRRTNLKFIFSWVSAAIEPEPNGLGLNVTIALKQASEYSKSPTCPFKPIEYASLRRAWYNSAYSELKGNSLHPLDLYSPLPLDK